MEIILQNLQTGGQAMGRLTLDLLRKVVILVCNCCRLAPDKVPVIRSMSAKADMLGSDGAEGRAQRGHSFHAEGSRLASAEYREDRAYWKCLPELGNSSVAKQRDC